MTEEGKEAALKEITTIKRSIEKRRNQAIVLYDSTEEYWLKEMLRNVINSLETAFIWTDYIEETLTKGEKNECTSKSARSRHAD